MSRCAYCTFVSSTELALMPRTMAALAREVGNLGRRGRRRLATLYLGGGTPSLVPPGDLERLLAAVWSSFEPVAGAEVTLEANPDDVTPERLAAWWRLGVNRLSIGVQSFDDGVLSLLSRRHSAADARRAAELALSASFTLSLDLMLGLPALRAETLDSTLAEVERLRPQHVSVYLLEMDKPHELARLRAHSPDLFPDEDTAARQYLAAGRRLVAAGYRHYEVSNFALEGFVARHNRRYWLGAPVLAAGPGAHGQSGRQRWANTPELAGYAAALEGGRTPRAWSRRLGDDEALREEVMLRFRLASGVKNGTVARCVTLCPELGPRLDEFLRLGLARELGGRIRLTPRGWLVSNELLQALW